ncbi:hypothetical protein MGG_15998 [Pyricularia oryzae 70-15]|uniref:Uncharacterized protein n=1 Tax=Pyricularia oryzae (strain 70-15 / ATCC MYA-4617 / FGSC 8958) TaxID=242507 RepID=G4MMS2_PYRO7|nr:uncharacterized protein MGG_15998 [Pyricularia oryzae 70-15]EHA56152.1 hypothetical protein MGG_15998 [Pyricularia oryzae 70-15]
MGRLVCWIETAKNLMEILRQKCPPLDSGYNEAARKREWTIPEVGRVDALAERANLSARNALSAFCALDNFRRHFGRIALGKLDSF